MSSVKAKVKSILISQPQPTGKCPYAAIQKKYKLKIDYRPFIHVEEISSIEFREQRISILNHDAVMFKIAVHDEDALNSFLDGSNPVSKSIFDEVMVSYEIFELNKV